MISQRLADPAGSVHDEQLPGVRGPLVRNPPWDPGNTYTMAWQSGWTAIGYNSDVDQEPGDSVGILFDRKYAGKVGMMSDPQELGSVGLLAIGVEPATSTEADWRKAATFLRKQRERRASSAATTARTTSTS